MNAKPLHIRLHKLGGCVKIYDGSRYLVLFNLERYDAIYDRIKYREKVEKGGITHSINNNFARITIDLHNFLPIQKTLNFHNVIIHITFHNVMILIKSVLNKNKNNYYCSIFLEKQFIVRINPIRNFLKWIFVYYKCYISIESTFLKELMLIRHVNQNYVIFLTVGSF